METDSETGLPINYTLSEGSEYKYKVQGKSYDPYMHMAIASAFKGVVHNQGGPFGATIVKNDHAIAVANNTVYSDNDPSCHAEMNCIRMACQYLRSCDLSGCTLYASGYPCPMCYGASQLTNVKLIYVAVDLETSSKYTFSDLNFYKDLNLSETERNIKIISGIKKNYIINMVQNQKFPKNEEFQEMLRNEFEGSDEFFMTYALSIASWTFANQKHTQKAPFGAIVVKNKKIIATGTNKVIEKMDVSYSAELEAIKNACQVEGSLNLSNCTLFCTVEPNLMSYACANWARLKSVVYGAPLSSLTHYGFEEELKQYDEAKSLDKPSIPIVSDCMKTESEEIFQLWKVSNGSFY